MTTRSEQKKELKRKKLVEAALNQFTSHDLQDVSISDLTKEAGIAKGTFYLFFSDKYELRDVVITLESEKILQTALDRLEQNDIRSFPDAIIYMINQILNQLTTNPVLLRLIKRNLSAGAFHRQLRFTAIEGKTDLGTRFVELAEKSGYHYENPQLVFLMILELTGSMCYSSIVENLPGPIEEVKPGLFDALRAIIESAKRVPEPAVH